ncbi:methyltransferase [Pseudomonas sp. NPDC088444]|uniref:methyltransferase n=1 Tax=Pseudomonas sp. NPDC088444 TaxID=3364456 RepID=UPI00384B6DA5
MENNNDILGSVSDYYSGKLALHGSTPQGVDWNGELSQTQRFVELCKIISQPEHFSVADIGCGYGALFDYIESYYRDFSYVGVDISESMIKAADARLQPHQNQRLVVGHKSDTVTDYSIASGIFNVRLDKPDAVWLDYIIQTLDAVNLSSKSGFSFNCLTSYSDQDRKRDYLYYADPCQLFDICKKRYSRQVALLHDYGLYEFTVLVRK